MAHYDHPDLKSLHAARAAQPRKSDPKIDEATFEAILRADPTIDTLPVVTRLIPDAGYVKVQQGFSSAPSSMGFLGGLRRFVLG